MCHTVLEGSVELRATAVDTNDAIGSVHEFLDDLARSAADIGDQRRYTADTAQRR
mgnify:CR=1 FL=1